MIISSLGVIYSAKLDFIWNDPTILFSLTEEPFVMQLVTFVKTLTVTSRRIVHQVLPTLKSFPSLR